MKELEILNINVESASEIIDFFKKFTGRELSEERIKTSIIKYPSCIAIKDKKIIGFAYTSSFAPDILELLNIFIHPNYRNMAIGTILLDNLEQQIKKKYAGLILVNSLLYENNTNKAFASNFYLRNNYVEIAATKNSKIYFKDFK